MHSTPDKFDSEMLNLFVKFALEHDLGVIPDPDEPWFSRKAIARIMGYADKTFSTYGWQFREIAHPNIGDGSFYRLNEFMKKVAQHASEAKGAKRRRDSNSAP